jgi:sialic acid synthase SpsE
MSQHIIETKMQIGNKLIGEVEPCFVIAEIGSNHNHDYDLALRLIDAAAEACVDAVKFQTFKASSHYSKKTPRFSHFQNTDTFDLIHSLEINRDWHLPLKEYSESVGLEFISSPCDSDAIIELDQLGISAFKLASFDLPDLSLIKQMAKTGRPIILSTGMANWMDIQLAIDTSRAVGNEKIALLQCTSLYPAPINLSNLNSIRTMKETFNVITGYSDHTLGDHMCIAAVSLGANIIEKHFTMDRDLPGPDHSFAIEPQELKQLMQRLRDVESAFGDGIKNGPQNEEREMYEKGRRSLHAATTIRKGQVIEKSDLVVKRPGLGVPPYLIEQVIGRIAKYDIEEDNWITWDMI